MRHLAPEADSRALLVLDAVAPTSVHDLDAAVRAAASLCLELARQGGCAVLLGGERRPRRVGPDLAAWPAVWARLAVVEPGAGVRLAGLAARPSALVYVTAAPVARLPAALGSGTRVLLVAPAGTAPPPARARAVLEVAGCRGYELAPARRAVAA